MKNSDNEINDGGPAFPGQKWWEFTQEWAPVSGMSLKDYFAAKAIAGVMSAWGMDGGSGGSNGFYPEEIAKKAYAIANAMIAERSKTDVR